MDYIIEMENVTVLYYIIPGIGKGGGGGGAVRLSLFVILIVFLVLFSRPRAGSTTVS